MVPPSVIGVHVYTPVQVWTESPPVCGCERNPEERETSVSNLLLPGDVGPAGAWVLPDKWARPLRREGGGVEKRGVGGTGDRQSQS
ncbi:hypothetical protein GW17_00052214 [Ensete ventricosum]|nr:hypothetical protein GW17_00052214 [Ensete ventricosum]